MPLLKLSKQSATASAVALAVFAVTSPVYAESMEHDPEMHHHHHEMASSAPWVKSTVDYKLPDVKLVRSDGLELSLPNEVDDGKPVILNFIYTSCTTVCPVMSQTFAEVQERLGAEAGGVRMVSISIDPEHDTPARLQEYAKHYNAGPQWRLYTGSMEASITAQKAFDAYRGDKMNHLPVTFIRSAPGQPWVRMEGFVSPDDIIREYRLSVRTK